MSNYLKSVIPTEFGAEKIGAQNLSLGNLCAMAHKTIRKENSLNDKFSETDAIIRVLAIMS
ncbi:MAG: hypothetical protein JHC73_00745 [Dolichospermum sp.]|nr:hypothetical protein [Dolichospermum sp.]